MSNIDPDKEADNFILGGVIASAFAGGMMPAIVMGGLAVAGILYSITVGPALAAGFGAIKLVPKIVKSAFPKQTNYVGIPYPKAGAVASPKTRWWQVKKYADQGTTHWWAEKTAIVGGWFGTLGSALTTAVYFPSVFDFPSGGMLFAGMTQAALSAAHGALGGAVIGATAGALASPLLKGKNGPKKAVACNLAALIACSSGVAGVEFIHHSFRKAAYGIEQQQKLDAHKANAEYLMRYRKKIADSTLPDMNAREKQLVSLYPDLPKLSQSDWLSTNTGRDLLVAAANGKIHTVYAPAALKQKMLAWKERQDIIQLRGVLEKAGEIEPRGQVLSATSPFFRDVQYRAFRVKLNEVGRAEYVEQHEETMNPWKEEFSFVGHKYDRDVYEKLLGKNNASAYSKAEDNFSASFNDLFRSQAIFCRDSTWMAVSRRMIAPRYFHRNNLANYKERLTM